ncbi:YdcF family protein [Dyella dinghuensis]|uniref:YdcF family protein n=1 Tax=Dyella dinghuensis TaxID=1920169 RepID=A0A432LVN4_9GAMM|nr:YdcF family protein [Dyella dinghuensis]RUL66090.1 YdcF family protein [Dyella dinghuensis]
MLILWLLVLVLIGFLFGLFRWRRCQWTLYGLALALFLASACGPLPKWLLTHLQSPYAVRPDISWAQRNAIVLLGAGTARIEDTDRVEPTIFADGRIIEAYALYRSCKQAGDNCKLVVSGGDAFHNGMSEADSYAAVLQSMGVDPSDLILDARSMNTWQNAQFVQPLLHAYQPQRVVLVTSAFHLRRAQAFFAHFGMDPTPVRGDYIQVRLTWLPNVWNMTLTDTALHEYIGILTYHLYNVLGWNAPPPSRYGAA